MALEAQELESYPSRSLDSISLSGEELTPSPSKRPRPVPQDAGVIEPPLVPGVDQGWLVDESELQVHLMPARAVRWLDDSHSRECRLEVEVAAITSPSPLLPLPRPSTITCKVLGRQDLQYEVVRGSERVVCCGRGTDIHILSARFPHSVAHAGFVFNLHSVDDGRCIGRADFLLKDFLSRDTTHETSYDVDVVSPDHQQQKIGTLHLNYLLINSVKGLPGLDNPASAELCGLHSARHSKVVQMWTLDPEGGRSQPRRRSLEMGHRGLGDSFRGLHLDESSLPESRSYERPAVIENTIRSFCQAADHGADFVEFDVQLTRDLVPVIYHDFKTCVIHQRPVRGAPGEGEGEGEEEVQTVLVGELSLEELGRLRLEHVKRCKKGIPAKMEVEESERVFPTLEAVLSQVPESLGFNIELKYPVPEYKDTKINKHRVDSDSEGLEIDKDYPFFDCNKFADTVLKVVYRHAGDRRIVFSCFNADMCTVMRLKQPRYPVLFLTVNGTPEFNVPVDMRSRTIQDAILHAQAQDLLGINIDSYQLLESEQSAQRWLDAVKERNLLLFTWGTKNTVRENVRRQREMGVHGVIYDRIDRFIEKDRNSATPGTEL